MRLIDIKRSINIAFENFHPKFSSNNTGTYYIDDIQKVKNAIRELDHIGFLHIKDSNDDLLAQINASITNHFILNGTQNEAYKTLFDKLNYSIVMLHQWINNYVTAEETETTINIKLPQIDNLKDFAAAGNTIKKALSRVIPEVGGEVRVKQFDHGSYWLIIDVGVIEAVLLVGGLVSTAFVILKKVLGVVESFKTIQSLDLDCQIKKITIKELEEKTIKKEALEKAVELNNKYFEKKNQEDNQTDINERIDRLSTSLSELIKLLKAGGEIHPSLIATQETENLYPRFEDKSLPFTPIGLLTTENYNGEINKEQEGDAE